jgi:MoxR-like ATPase
VIGGDFKRIQFTPDMLPADVTGFYLYTPDGRSRLIQGPISANVVLADELNRTTPRTQAALIEAMQEKQVTIEGETRMLPKPFMVIASQLPYGSEGTYPLTEVQADRFMYRVWSDYLDRDYEEQVLSRIDYIEQPDIKPVASLKDIIELQQEVKKVHVSDKVRQYIVSLIIQARKDPDVLTGPSTRAGIAFFKGARTLAYLQGRDYVLPDDVKKLVSPVLAHRIHVKSEAEMEDITADMIIERVTKETPVPKID